MRTLTFAQDDRDDYDNSSADCSDSEEYDNENNNENNDAQADSGLGQEPMIIMYRVTKSKEVETED